MTARLRPSLRPEVRPVRIGSHTILFLGGPRLLRSNGPAVSRVILPLLEAMDGRADTPRLLETLSPEDADKARAFLSDLESAGLLADGPPGNRQIHRTGRFVQRFAGLIDPRSAGPVAPEDFGRATLSLAGEASRLGGLASLLEAAGLIPRVGRSAAGPMRTVATMRLRSGNKQRDVLLEMPLAGQGPVLTVGSSPPVADGQGRTRTDGAEQGSAAVAATIAHWAVLACAGLPAVGRIGEGTRRRQPTAPKDAARGTMRAAACASPDLPAVLSEICRYAVGRETDGARRIAPTAGGLGSPQVVCIAAGWQGSDSAAAFHFDAAANRLVRAGTLDVKAWREIGAEPAGSTTIFFLANLMGLEEAYGAEAERLAHHDGGIALDHAVRAAAAFGCRATPVPVANPGALLKVLRLPSDDGRLAVTAALALENAGEQGGLPTTAANDKEALLAMLRRRSVRRFAMTAPSLKVVEKIEADLRETRAREAAGRRNNVRTRLFRLVAHQGGSDTLTEISLGNRGGPPEPPVLLGPGFLQRLVRQPDLAGARLCYVVAHSKPASSGPRFRGDWTEAGSLCSALWLAAGRRGIAGAPFGTGAVDLLPLPRAVVAQPLCLCLGIPTGIIR